MPASAAFWLCTTWLAVLSFVGLVFAQLIIGRWKVTLALGAALLLVAWLLRDRLFILPVVRSCVPGGGLVALLGATGWAWSRGWRR